LPRRTRQQAAPWQDEKKCTFTRRSELAIGWAVSTPRVCPYLLRSQQLK